MMVRLRARRAAVGKKSLPSKLAYPAGVNKYSFQCPSPGTTAPVSNGVSGCKISNLRERQKDPLPGPGGCYCIANQRPLWVSSRMQTSFIGAFNKQSNVIEHFHYACVSRICSAIMDVLNVSSLRFSYTVYHGVDGVVVLLNERTPLPLHGVTFSLCFNLCWTHHSSTSRLHPKHLPSQEDNNPTPTVSGTIDTENG